MNKVCKKCGSDYPIENYDWADRKRGYKKSYCRSCCMKIYADWKIEKPNKHMEWLEKYYMEHPEQYGVTGNPKGRPKGDETLKSGVYLITNKVTGETYVGCSSNVKRRIWRHLDYNRGRAKQKGLSKAIKEFGREAFEAEVLEYCPKEQIFEREKVWMEKYGCEYNRNKADGTK